MEKTSNKVKKGLFALVPIFLGIFIAAFAFGNTGLPKEKTIASVSNTNQKNEIEVVAKEDIQKYFYSIGETKEPRILAESYIVGDLATGEIIMAKNADKKFPIASVSKLMTAHVANELYEEGEITKVSKKALATYGQNGNFRVGEKIKVSELIHPLLLESSNDAAEILAEHWGRDTFMNKMNLEAARIKMVDTFYDDPSGLSEKNISTVSDVFKLAGYVKQNSPELFELTTKRTYKNKAHAWFSNNQFLSMPGYAGGKSGFTNPAKQTVISTFNLALGKDKENKRPIAIVLLRSADRQKDVQNIVRYLNKNVYYGGLADAKADWIKERLDIPDIREPDYITLHFVGDIMLDRGVRSSVNKNFGGDYSLLFTKVDHLDKADIAFANLEGPASDRGRDLKNLYSFRMDPAVIPAMKGAGISIVSMANNHIGDWGRDAFTDTLSRLTENEIAYTGAGMTKQEAETPTIIEKYGMKIGYLGFSDVGPNGMAAKADSAGILLASDPRFAEIVKNAASQVDHLIVSFHWGEEYKTKNNTRQQQLAYKAIDNGAKMVIGHHPHVMQNTEVYKNGFIAYSLGNFIFDQKFSAETMQGMLLELKIHKDGSVRMKKNTVKLNKFFQPDKIIFGKEEKLRFQNTTPALNTKPQ
ncbi:MAG: CapA family protein [Candidatus Paceibacterota bacterium]